MIILDLKQFFAIHFFLYLWYVIIISVPNVDEVENKKNMAVFGCIWYFQFASTVSTSSFKSTTWPRLFQLFMIKNMIQYSTFVCFWIDFWFHTELSNDNLNTLYKYIDCEINYSHNIDLSILSLTLKLYIISNSINFTLFKCVKNIRIFLNF